MNADAQELVRQLTEKPEVLESMQHLISLLRANPQQCPGTSNDGSRSNVETTRPERGAQQWGRPPRSGCAANVDYGRHQTTNMRKLHSSDGAGRSANSPSASSLTQETHSFYSDDRVYARSTVNGHNGATGGAASPTPSFATTGLRGAPQGLTAASRRGLRHSPLLSTPHEHRSVTAPDEQLMATATKLTDAQRRIAELEKELQHTTQRVDQLSDVVQRQKDELQTAQDRHLLEMEELRHSYNAVIQRKDEVQGEALRQLLKSRQLMVSAAKYEAVVTAKKSQAQQLAKENNHGVDDGMGSIKVLAGMQTAYSDNECDTRPGLAQRQTSVNAQHSSVLGYRSSTAAKYSSALKRERQNDDEDVVTDVDLVVDAYEPGDARYGATTQKRPPAKRSTADSWRLQGSTDRAVQGRRGVAATNAETSPAYITTPTLCGKTSTALVETRTQPRSARKRRTPRTPSLTNADRLAGSVAGNSARLQQRLPGTTSLKIESPTPVASTAWTADRSLTSSHTPPPHPSGGMNAASEAVIKPHHLSQQQSQQPSSTKPPLTQRAAGRLPPAHHRAAAAPTAVPNTRSGTSSIASGGPTRSPSPVNPKRGSTLPRRFIFTGLKDHEPQRLASAIAAVGDDAAALASDLDEPPPSSTTHIVLRGTPRSVKALCGVVSGKWLVSPEYVYNSQQSGFWLDELEEGGLRIFPPPLKCQRFLLTVEHPSIRAKLAQVIEYGGGEVLPSGSGKHGASAGSTVAQDVIVITSGDDLLRYATQDRV
ncbi:hypothetical protein LPMP_100300 [Leishmania panamensis]|uniref:BRCT domain-containing protein n=1 Tax=Leishmania panamensis TaxID=5679 RepID=A0A088RLN3_LEIPA|nr:hypothetical protein LPMP_100300 [Leishmania panamensis]AIN96099.1 hypothetical protein LPMP_100300 [Leishmania panamensis]